MYFHCVCSDAATLTPRAVGLNFRKEYRARNLAALPQTDVIASDLHNDCNASFSPHSFLLFFLVVLFYFYLFLVAVVCGALLMCFIWVSLSLVCSVRRLPSRQ